MSILFITLITAIPSVYFAYQLVIAERFSIVANHLINKIESENKIIVLNRKIDAKEKRIILYLSGERKNLNIKNMLNADFAQEGILANDIVVKFIGGNQLNIANLKKEFIDEIQNNYLLSANNVKLIGKENERFEVISEQLNAFNQIKNEFIKEIINEYPEFINVKILSESTDLSNNSTNSSNEKTEQQINNSEFSTKINAKPLLLLLVETKLDISRNERKRLSRRLSVNFESFQTELIIRKVSNSNNN